MKELKGMKEAIDYKAVRRYKYKRIKVLMQILVELITELEENEKKRN